MVDFLDIVDERLRLHFPVVVKQVGGKFLDSGQLHGYFPHIVIIVEVVLPAVADNIPVATVDVACWSDIAETAVVHPPARVDKTFAHRLPPFAVLVQPLVRGETVPGVVHHLRAAVEIGAEEEVMPLDIGYHGLVFGLEGIQRGSAEGVGIIAVEVHAVGVVAPCKRHRAVAAVVSAVGIGEGIDIDAGAVEQTRDLLRGAIAAQQRVAQAQHQIKARQLVTVHGGGIEEFGAVKIVVRRTGDGQTED